MPMITGQSVLSGRLVQRTAQLALDFGKADPPDADTEPLLPAREALPEAEAVCATEMAGALTRRSVALRGAIEGESHLFGHLAYRDDEEALMKFAIRALDPPDPVIAYDYDEHGRVIGAWIEETT